MYVSVQYFDEQANAYGGKSYTYKTDLPLVPYQKVIVPTYKGDKKAIIKEINLPDSCVEEAWKDKLKTISEVDKG